MEGIGKSIVPGSLGVGFFRLDKFDTKSTSLYLFNNNPVMSNCVIIQSCIGSVI